MAFVGLEEAARILHTSFRNVKRWAQEDPDFPAVEVSPGRWKVASGELEAWTVKRHRRLHAEREAAHA